MNLQESDLRQSQGQTVRSFLQQIKNDTTDFVNNQVSTIQVVHDQRLTNNNTHSPAQQDVNFNNLRLKLPKSKFSEQAAHKNPFFSGPNSFVVASKRNLAAQQNNQPTQYIVNVCANHDQREIITEQRAEIQRLTAQLEQLSNTINAQQNQIRLLEDQQLQNQQIILNQSHDIELLRELLVECRNTEQKLTFILQQRVQQAKTADNSPYQQKYLQCKRQNEILKQKLLNQQLESRVRGIQTQPIDDSTVQQIKHLLSQTRSIESERPDDNFNIATQIKQTSQGVKNDSSQRTNSLSSDGDKQDGYFQQRLSLRRNLGEQLEPYKLIAGATIDSPQTIGVAENK